MKFVLYKILYTKHVLIRKVHTIPPRVRDGHPRQAPRASESEPYRYTSNPNYPHIPPVGILVMSSIIPSINNIKKENAYNSANIYFELLIKVHGGMSFDELQKM